MIVTARHWTVENLWTEPRSSRTRGAVLDGIEAAAHRFDLVLETRGFAFAGAGRAVARHAGVLLSRGWFDTGGVVKPLLDGES